MGLLAGAGCGNNYRPVITAINPVGPASQPTKYAVAISDPNLGDPNGTLPGLVTFVDFSGDTVLITANVGVKPYYLILGSGGDRELFWNLHIAAYKLGAADHASGESRRRAVANEHLSAK
jgi:hypothetical protein